LEDFELIVIDDASSDNTAQEIEKVCDPRIQLHKNSKNLGVAASRNRGHVLATGEYIAHCDHDDLWEPSKLQKQVNFLNTHPAYGLVSTQLKKFQHGKEFRDISPLRSMPTTAELRWSLIFDSSFAHSAILYRRSVIDAHNLLYSSDYTFADDWDFFVKMSQVTEIAILHEKLTQYHLGEANWSILAANTMLSGGAKLCHRELQDWLKKELPKTLSQEFFNICVSGSPCKTTQQLEAISALLFRLHNSFEKRTNLEESQKVEVRNLTRFYWWRMVQNTAYNYGPKFVTFSLSIPRPEWLHIGTKKRAWLTARSCLKSIRRTCLPA